MRNSKDTFTSPIKAGHRPAGRRGGITLKLGMTLALGVGAVLGFMKLRGSDDSSGGVKIPPNAKIKWVVKRGNLTISALAAGTLKTKNTTQIINELEKPTKIVWLIDEGTQVKQGDKLIELDAADLNEQLMKQKIRNAEVEQNEQKAKDDLAIADSKAKTDLIAAENKVTIAKLDLLKYKEGDFLQDKRKKESAVAIAQEELNRAKDKLEWTRKLAQKDYVTHNDLAADEFALTKCQIQLDTAREDLDLLNKFTYHRETSKLETALIEAEGDLERVRLTNQRELASKQAALEAATATAELERINTKNLEEQIAKAVLFAPRDGMVVYYKERYRESQQSMQIGTQLMPRQRLIDLPDFSAWMIEARVHESLIQKIKVGERAFVTIDAFADKVLEGTVSKISVLPDNSDWWRDAQEYIVQIDLTVKQPNFKPGMSAKAEIIEGELKDVLSAPVQAIAGKEGKTFVWVQSLGGGEQREVQVGENNERMVEIKSGLKEGDVVLMDQAIGGGTGLGLRPAEKATDAQRATAGEAAKAAQKSPGSKEHKRGSDGSVKPAAESNAAGRGGVGTEESPSPGSEGTGKAREQKLGATSAGEGPGVRRNSKRSRGENGNSQSEGSRERK